MLHHLITKELRANLQSMIIVVLAFAFLVPILFTLAPTTTQQAAMPGEILMPIMTIICLPIVFLPDQASAIQAVINSKHYQLILLHAIRLLLFTLVLSLLDGSLLIVYACQHPPFTLLPLLADFMIKIWLITGIVATSYRMTKSIVATYIIPITYFALCLGYRGLGPLNLLTLVQKRPVTDLWWQLLVALGLLVIGLIPFKLLVPHHQTNQ